MEHIKRIVVGAVVVALFFGSFFGLIHFSAVAGAYIAATFGISRDLTVLLAVLSPFLVFLAYIAGFIVRDIWASYRKSK